MTRRDWPVPGSKIARAVKSDAKSGSWGEFSSPDRARAIFARVVLFSRVPST